MLTNEIRTKINDAHIAKNWTLKATLLEDALEKSNQISYESFLVADYTNAKDIYKALIETYSELKNEKRIRQLSKQVEDMDAFFKDIEDLDSVDSIGEIKLYDERGAGILMTMCATYLHATPFLQQTSEIMDEWNQEIQEIIKNCGIEGLRVSGGFHSGVPALSILLGKASDMSVEQKLDLQEQFLGVLYGFCTDRCIEVLLEKHPFTEKSFNLYNGITIIPFPVVDTEKRAPAPVSMAALMTQFSSIASANNNNDDDDHHNPVARVR